MSTWYWKTAQFAEPQGPVSPHEIKKLVLTNRLHPDSFVRKEGMEDWIPARRLKGLFDNSGDQQAKEHATTEAPQPSLDQQPTHSPRVHHSTGMYQKKDRQESNWGAGNSAGTFGGAEVLGGGAMFGHHATGNEYSKGMDYEPMPDFFSFRGRIRRTTYFLHSFGISMILMILMLVVGFVMGGFAEEEPIGAVIAIVLLSIAGTVVLSFPHVKRLHDLNLSAWFYWIGLIPFVNVLFGLYVLFGRGTEGPNKYGPDPRE